MTLRILPTLLALWLGCSPTLEEGRTAGDCSDAADNDGDGIFDCDDDGCAASPECGSQDSGDTDADGDGYGDPVVGRCRCSAAGGEVDDNTDSDDTDPAVH